MRCLGSARFNMLVDVLKPDSSPEANGQSSNGNWQYVQDPDSGAIVRVWVADDPDTPNSEGGILAVPCLFRGVIDGGIRVAGTTERFSEIYENVDWAKMTFPASVNITKRDRITNVRDWKGNIIWREEEMDGSPATVFEVRGITPIINPFGRHVENIALLERAEVQ